MKRILAAIALASLTGCQAVSDAGNSIIDGIKAPPAYVTSSFNQIFDFLLSLITQALAVFGGNLGLFSL